MLSEQSDQRISYQVFLTLLLKFKVLWRTLEGSLKVYAHLHCWQSPIKEKTKQANKKKKEKKGKALKTGTTFVSL